jgi:hypothetical protein
MGMQAYEEFRSDLDESMNRLWKQGNYEFHILRDEQPGFWRIKKPNKGSTPSCLTGKYTSVGYARKDIEAYVNRTKHLMERDKAKKNRQAVKNPDIEPEVLDMD